MIKIVVAGLLLLMLGGCGNGHAGSTNNEQHGAARTTQTSTVSVDKEVKVSVAAVVELMHDRFGENVDLSGIEIKQVGQRYQYEVEALGDNDEHKMILNGRTGAIIRQTHERLDGDDAGGADRHEHAIPTAKLRALGDITQAATKAVPGTAIAWSLEQDDGVPTWEVHVRTKRDGVHEVKVQADDATVLHTEHDDGDDD